MFSFVVDVHRNILSAQCSLKCDLTNTTINNLKVMCSKTQIIVIFYHNNEVLKQLTIATPENFFIPTSVLRENAMSGEIALKDDILTVSQKCPVFKKATSECHQNSESTSLSYIDDNNCSNSFIDINFRIQISNSDLIPLCDDSQSMNTLFKYLKSEINCQESYNVICTNCDSLLTSNGIVFQQIREYCDSFSDLSESWFCHKAIAPQSILQENTLHVDECSIYLHSDTCKSLCVESDTEIKCKSCRTILTSGCVGDSKGQRLICFYADKIMFKSINSMEINSKGCQKKVVMLSLWTIISQKACTCRLFFQSNGDGSSECLLMWVPPSRTAQFKIHSTLDNLATEVNFVTSDVCKVQYYIGALSSTPVKEWSKDFNVDFYKVSTSFIVALKEMLIASTEIMTGTNIKMDGFSYGCLPCSLPHV